MIIDCCIIRAEEEYCHFTQSLLSLKIMYQTTALGKIYPFIYKTQKRQKWTFLPYPQNKLTGQLFRSENYIRFLSIYVHIIVAYYTVIKIVGKI